MIILGETEGHGANYGMQEGRREGHVLLCRMPQL